jgi:hypothetical protein
MAYISFQHKDTIASPLKRAIMVSGSGGPFVHCEIVLDNMQKQVCSAWYPEGVSIRPHQPKVYPHLWENFQLGYVDEFFLRFFAMKKETKYTLKGLVINMALDSAVPSNRTFCSQVCYEAMNEVFPGVLPQYVPSSLSPFDLYNIIKSVHFKQTLTNYGTR